MPAGSLIGKSRLYGDGVFPTASGRAHFVNVEHQETAEIPDRNYPISLISGRLRDQWHGMSRTGTVARLFNLDEEPLISMHADDMRERSLVEGDLVRLSNLRCSIVVRVKESDGLKSGRAWMPMHWGNKFMNSAGVNALTPSAVDPYSQQPELKHAAIAVDKVDLPWQLVIIRKGEQAAGSYFAALALLERARALLPEFTYATIGLYGRAQPLVVFRAALAEALPEARLLEIDALFGLDDETSSIFYADKRRQVSKRAVAPDGILTGVRLAGETLAQRWIKEVMADDALDPSLVRWTVAPIGKPPVNLPAKSRVVCKCADVTEAQIRTELAQGGSVAALQDKLKCGTFCGSCVPELKQIKQMLSTTAVPVDA
jgi:assimilatory nitrate reductase catalytic subunit